MDIVIQNNVPLGTFKNLSQYSRAICHFVTTRNGGVSVGEYQNFNLSLNQNDNPNHVLENRKRLANAVGLNQTDFVFPVQVHGVNIPHVTEVHRGRGCFSASDAFLDTDGFITNTPGLCLISLAADCVPIIFFDPVNKAVGVAHAGWKGTVLRIPSYLVKAMSQRFGTNPSNLIVGIGPSGGPCCYEVGQDVINEVAQSFDTNKVIKPINGKTIFDMWLANTITLTESGVKPENIEVAGLCTISQNDTFFSARRGDGGRFVAGIFLL